MAPGEEYARLEDYEGAMKVLVDRRPISVRADRPEDDPAERAWLDRYGLSAALLLPLVSRGESLGLMYLARREGHFSQDDLVYSHSSATSPAARSRTRSCTASSSRRSRSTAR